MSRRRRTRLQRLKQSFVVTFSAAAAGSGGCDALADPSSDDEGPSGRIAAGPVAGVGGVSFNPVIPTSENPPFVAPTPMPCPETAPVNGASCMPTAEPICMFPPGVPESICVPMRATAECRQNVWIVQTMAWGCNPPVVTPPDPPIEEDAGLDGDAGLDDDA
jgi:hypothetical protein